MKISNEAQWYIITVVSTQYLNAKQSAPTLSICSVRLLPFTLLFQLCQMGSVLLVGAVKAIEPPDVPVVRGKFLVVKIMEGRLVV